MSYRDYPRTGIANLAVDTSGGVSAGELLGAAQHALYLLRPLAAIRLDPRTDSYRIIASGVWLDGRSVRGWHPVVELRGSLGRLLRRIEAVGTDLRWFQTSQGFVGTPSLLIRRQPVVGSGANRTNSWFSIRISEFRSPNSKNVWSDSCRWRNRSCKSKK